MELEKPPLDVTNKIATVIQIHTKYGKEVVFEMTILIKSNGGIWSKASHSINVSQKFYLKQHYSLYMKTEMAKKQAI